MRSLADLLEAASTRAAVEVQLESGQPVVYTTARGTEAESTVLPRAELFDMIVAAVNDEQQIELAVGNPVEFTLEAGESWTIYAEPGQEGMRVQARCEGAEPGLEIDLDYGAGSAGPGGFGLDISEPTFDVSLSPADPPPASAPRPNPGSRSPRNRGPRDPSKAPPSQLHVEALEVPSLDDSSGVFQVAKEAPAAPFESGTWALEDDDEFDVGFGEDASAMASEDSLPTGFSDEHIGVPEDDDDLIGVPADDDERAEYDPFGPPPAPPEPSVSPRHTLSPTVRAMEASPRPEPPPASVSAPHGVPGGDPDFNARVTMRDVGVPAPRSRPDSSTHRELPSQLSSPVGLSGLMIDVAEGSLVFVREAGLAESLADSAQAPSLIITDDHSPGQVWARVRQLPPGAILVVLREDPSELLDGLLRRLEEGYRVFIETRARTLEGARRVLLGVSASERAERWLDAQTVYSVEPGEGGPRLVSG